MTGEYKNQTYIYGLDMNKDVLRQTAILLGKI